MIKTMLKTTILAASLLALPTFGAAQHAGQAQLFVVAGRCMACHNGVIGPDGQDISFGTSWRASMMANSARDPYWQAALRRETLDHPEASAALQDECSKCHMPMARFQAHAAGEEFQVFGKLPWEPGTGIAPEVLALARDGVSCTMCHQIQPEGLGTEETFVGEFHVDTETPLGQRPVFGPYEVPEGSSRAMLSSGQFMPTQGEHIRAAGLCASCHTLITHARNDAGEVIGNLPEQVPFLEWLSSDYRDQQSCQACHMPKVDRETAISSVLPNPHPDVRRHVFRGGNFFVPRILNLYRNELAVTALPAELDAMINGTRQFLADRAARVALEGGEVEGGVLRFDVAVTNLAGHKLPTAYPSRRVWLHVTVTDAAGATVFESGALRRDGSIVGNDNDVDGSSYEPHYSTIDHPEQVQIYESILGDFRGRVTTGLIYGVEYLKDNRVLPRGFDKRAAGPDIAVHGAALEDGNFAGAGDHVRYRVDVGRRTAPFTVRVELWYQPIGFRWAHNLAEYDAPEPNRFVRFYDSLSHVSGTLLAETEAALPDG